MKEKVLNLEFKRALEKIIELSTLGNKYFQENEPWKADEEKKKRVLMFSANLVKDLAILLWPFIPSFSEKVFDMLDIEKFFFGSFKRVGKIELKNKKLKYVEIIFKPLKLE